MFNKILLPLDGSEIAEIALLYGEELAKVLGSQLVLFHIPGPEQREEYRHIHQMYLERLAESIQQHIHSGLPESAKASVIVKVEAGEPKESICKLVGENNIDLVIMSSVSASGLKIGKMLGSVTDHICRTVPIPVMLIRPQSVKRTMPVNRLINHIILPLDGSDLSKLALPIGEELAIKLNAGITLFQMANILRPYYDEMGGGASFYAKFNEEELQQVRSEITSLQKDLEANNIKVNSVVTQGFDAAADIIETSKRVSADLTVMSTHGRSGLSQWVLGSVAEKVLRHGDTPLLLVHARAV